MFTLQSYGNKHRVTGNHKKTLEMNSKIMNRNKILGMKIPYQINKEHICIIILYKKKNKNE